MSYALGKTVTRQRATAVLDRYSKREDDLSWDDPSEVDYPGCAVWQEDSSEPDEEGRTRTITRTKVAVDVDADVHAGDRFVIDGLTYDVEGDPAEWRSPYTGWAPGLLITGKRVDG